MAKKQGGGKAVSNLLNLSGLIFAFAGAFHVLRYWTRLEFRVAGFELTPLGSLIIGACLLFLSFACFRQTKK